MQTDVTLLEGEIAEDSSRKQSANGYKAKNLDTLDEPIVDTLLRDLKGIFVKVKHILFPLSQSDANKSLLRDWDLWGPLILCTFVALILHHGDDNVDGKVGPHFAEIFVLIWFGSLVVSLNYKLLALSTVRRKSSTKAVVCPSIFQLLCVFGYCLSPPSSGILLLKVISFILNPPSVYMFYCKLFIGTVLGFILPTLSAVKILQNYQDKEKRLLAIYPIALFYFILSWVIISSH
ncbi:integral membrane protein-like protein [Dinothrombium tinctorium]|uniref:Integral membrane protein-like protein n=1 Tax=Dinothrombium tinctorium TaxID=1965070 RepID=A0A3S3Q8A6_9ACAR|nr:integral membrane protein-like protein [Dinothrombium tinctorium]